MKVSINSHYFIKPRKFPISTSNNPSINNNIQSNNHSIQISSNQTTTAKAEEEADEDFKTNDDYINSCISVPLSHHINKTVLNLPTIPSRNINTIITRNATDREAYYQVKISNQILQRVLKNANPIKIIIGDKKNHNNRSQLIQYHMKSSHNRNYNQYNNGINCLKANYKNTNSLLLSTNYKMYYNQNNQKLNYIKEMFKKAILDSTNGIKCPLMQL